MAAIAKYQKLRKKLKGLVAAGKEVSEEAMLIRASIKRVKALLSEKDLKAVLAQDAPKQANTAATESTEPAPSLLDTLKDVVAELKDAPAPETVSIASALEAPAEVPTDAAPEIALADQSAQLPSSWFAADEQATAIADEKPGKSKGKK